MYFLYYTELPLSGVGFSYRELTNKEQLALSKANTSLPMEGVSIVKYGELFRTFLSDIIKNKEDLFKLNLIDYFLLITKIRETTLGDELELVLENSEEENLKITYRLNVFMYELYDIAKNLSRKISLDEDLIVEIDWPSYNSEEFFLKNCQEKNISNYISDSVCEYVKKIYLKDKIINFWDLTHEEKQILYDKLPAKLHSMIEKAVFENIKNLFDANLFKLSKPEYGKFNFYNLSYQKFQRLFFVENLQSLYRDYFILMCKRIDINFIHKSSVSEKRIFISLLEEQMESNNEGEDNQSAIPFKDSMMDFDGA